MINRIRQPVAKSISAACLIVLAMGFTAAPPAADGGMEGPIAGAVASLPADDCLLFINYWELDFIVFQRYHMLDHGRGLGDPAETEDPRGEWMFRGVVFAENDPHGLERGYTQDHDTHVPCQWNFGW